MLASKIDSFGNEEDLFKLMGLNKYHKIDLKNLAPAESKK